MIAPRWNTFLNKRIAAARSDALADGPLVGAEGPDGDTEAGFVVVMVALLLVLLLAFIGYGVDLGVTNIERNKSQAAAEAAALGGVTFLPEQPLTAFSTATEIAELHGYDPSQINVAIGSAPNRLVVTIDDEVEHYFISMVGIDSTDIQARVEAEFQPVLELGSPDFVIGNDPENNITPNYWLSIAGTDAPKDLGDRFMTGPCTDPATAGCGIVGGTFGNLEQDFGGYNFAVPITTPGQYVRVQVFDPAWVWTGSDCSFPFWPTAAEIAQLQAFDDAYGQIPAGYYDDAASRFAVGDTKWCTGDDRPGATGTSTNYTVRYPDDTPWDDLDNPPTPCAPSFGGFEPMSPYLAPTYTIFELLSPTSGANQWQVDPNDGRWTFAEVFRRWVTICEMPVGVTGDMIVQVQTTGGTGQNRFALRSGPPSGSNGIVDAGQSTYARGRLPIYVNSNLTTTTFRPIRVTPAGSERLLEVTFFDIGDASSAGSIRISPPPDANMAAFPNCEFTRSDGVTLASNTDCSISSVLDTNGYDGQVVTAQVPIPPTYTCSSTPNGCWVKIEATFSGGITDATTWSARIEGDAVRIVG